MMALVALLATLLMTSCVTSQREPKTHQGTTENIQSVFTGRCWDYDVTKYNNILPRVDAGCNELWDKFFDAFSFSSPCDVQKANYDSFYALADQNLPEDKVMFWSGVYTLSHRFAEAGHNYVTLEDTIIGYLVNSLVWCGQLTKPGVNYTACPEWSDCPLEASESFWAGASATFAKQAKGKVTLMVDGSNPDKPAYRRSSFFGKHELPSMSDAVNEVHVLVTHTLDKPKIEFCGSGSLVDLEEDVTKRGFSYECEDDPVAVMHLLCANEPSSRECLMALAHASGQLADITALPGRHMNAMPDQMAG
ncbi:ADP-ribosyl cyclase/cyclic ADP-ribose hydrolase [Aplysia californica]|uniref:ADP-ribosyl cyclase/cyclic ADP-ribose hydrolase n=1 Tax=Aplysia californica TaxID=6500 RepID=A0ABM1A5M7_APLCA|nr:ADP-ribosyl cyclase/cyclic ADP-ribose hydrolase [Aplysia californica]XP_012941293.1 ADP-ribosyl cyclase/cyclic ADP-ribose hydrolase [Aplysia californica]